MAQAMLAPGFPSANEENVVLCDRSHRTPATPALPSDPVAEAIFRASREGKIPPPAMTLKTSMTAKNRIHDGIVGALVLSGILLGLTQGPIWLYATGALAALMIQSAFTGFCPVYWALDRFMADEQPNRSSA